MTTLVEINDNLLTEIEAAKILDLSVSTLQKYRGTGEGPKYIKYNRKVRYTKKLCYEWLNSKICKSTADSNN